MNRAASGFIKALTGTALVVTLARAAQFAMAALLAAQLGVEGFGIFAFALSAAVVAGQIGALGWPVLNVRLIARFAQTRDAAQLDSLISLSRLGAGAGALLTAAGLGLAAATARAQGDDAMAVGLGLAALIAPTAVFRRLFRMQLVGFFRPRDGAFLEDAAAPVAVTLLALAPGFSTPLAPGLVFFAAAAVAAAAGWALSQAGAARLIAGMPAESGARPTPHAQVKDWAQAKDWAITALTLLGTQIPRLIITRSDVLLIAPILGFEATGIYAVAMRLAYLVSAPPLILAQVMQPWITRAFHAENRRRLMRVLGLGLGAIAAYALVALAATFWFGEALTSLFGAEFRPAAALIPALAAAEALTALGIPLVFIVVSGENYRRHAAIGLALTAAHVGLFATLLPREGLTAAPVIYLGVSASLFLITATLAFNTLRAMPSDKSGKGDQT